MHANGSSSPRKAAQGAPGSRLCPLPKRLAKRKPKENGERTSAVGQQGVISVRSASPASLVASPGHVDATNVLCPDGEERANGTLASKTVLPAPRDQDTVRPGHQSAPTLELPSQLPAEASGPDDATSSLLRQSKSLSPSAAKSALDSFRQKKTASFVDRFNAAGKTLGQTSAVDELIKVWYENRVRELADGQRCDLQMALLAEGAEHAHENVNVLLDSFRSRVVNNTSVIDRLSSRMKYTFTSRLPENAQSLDRRCPLNSRLSPYPISIPFSHRPSTLSPEPA